MIDQENQLIIKRNDRIREEIKKIENKNEQKKQYVNELPLKDLIKLLQEKSTLAENVEYIGLLLTELPDKLELIERLKTIR